MPILPLIAAAALLLPLAAGAQSRPPADPADPKAAVAPLSYTSAFRQYRALDDGGDHSPDRQWRAANREVGDLGGHAGHMREPAGGQAQAVRPPTPGADHDAHHGGAR